MCYQHVNLRTDTIYADLMQRSWSKSVLGQWKGRSAPGMMVGILSDCCKVL